jgi:4'-phosphopantetheinyl transferase
MTKWESPPADLTLPADEVHVWCALLGQPERRVCQLASTLAPDEQARAERYRLERDRDRFLVRRGILRHLLGRYLGREAKHVEICYGAYGRPSLAHGCGEGRLRFSLAHSGQMALFAFARGREVGIDIESVRPMPDADRIAARFFSPREAAALHALPPEERQQAFFACWTRKEAYLKAKGVGLSGELRQFEVAVIPKEPARLLNVGGDPHRALEWSLEDLAPAPGYAAALAVEGRRWELARWCWE